jgi:heme-degrading monooxygenase HmoA
MITVMAIFVMADGHDVAWDDVWRRATTVCEQQPGLRSARLLRDVNRPGRYIFHSEWDQREDADYFVRKSGFLWLQRGLDLFAEHPSIHYFDRVGEPFATQ